MSNLYSPLFKKFPKKFSHPHTPTPPPKLTWNLQVWSSMGNFAKFIGHMNLIRVAKTNKTSWPPLIQRPWKIENCVNTLASFFIYLELQPCSVIFSLACLHECRLFLNLVKQIFFWNFFTLKKRFFSLSLFDEEWWNLLDDRAKINKSDTINLRYFLRKY